MVRLVQIPKLIEEVANIVLFVLTVASFPGTLQKQRAKTNSNIIILHTLNHSPNYIESQTKYMGEAQVHKHVSFDKTDRIRFEDLPFSFSLTPERL